MFARTVVVLFAVGPLAHAGPPIPTVLVPHVRDPVDKSYVKMIKGMDRFERDRALAPAAVLRFRLLPRLPGTTLAGVTLRVAGQRVSLPLALAADHSFVLPRSAEALRDNAAVLANRKSDAMTWRAWVQTPGLAAGTRRLGDLRLECRVGMDAGAFGMTAGVFVSIFGFGVRARNPELALSPLL